MMMIMAKLTNLANGWESTPAPASSTAASMPAPSTPGRRTGTCTETKNQSGWISVPTTCDIVWTPTGATCTMLAPGRTWLRSNVPIGGVCAMAATSRSIGIVLRYVVAFAYREEDDSCEMMKSKSMSLSNFIAFLRLHCIFAAYVADSLPGEEPGRREVPFVFRMCGDSSKPKPNFCAISNTSNSYEMHQEQGQPPRSKGGCRND